MAHMAARTHRTRPRIHHIAHVTPYEQTALEAATIRQTVEDLRRPRMHNFYSNTYSNVFGTNIATH
eukprot:6556851-Prorocentrum_lima.AAC.1